MLPWGTHAWAGWELALGGSAGPPGVQGPSPAHGAFKGPWQAQIPGADFSRTLRRSCSSSSCPKL